MEQFDVIVAGGGIAGSTSAAALAQKGLKVLLCEVGLPSTKRLAGELLHPPGYESLDKLGLADALEAAGGIPVYGFAVFRSADDPGNVLSYSEVPGGRPTGIALEHGKLTRTLLSEVAKRPGVTVWNKARVTDADLDAARPVVTVKRDGQVVQAQCDLVVSAEGRTSKLRERADIATREEPPFRMVGWKIPGGRLPYPGYGHVFIGGPTAILAYQVAVDEVRIMFELEMEHGPEIPEPLLFALPEPFRSDVRHAMKTQPRSTARFVGFKPECFTGKDKLAVVGDAGGCVHPLIASGMSFCAGDAHRLADSVGPILQGRTMPEALREYERARLGPMRTRSALGPAMVEALVCGSPEMRLLRHGLFKYWKSSMRGRSASMGLLSTRETSMVAMAREYALVCAYAAPALTNGVIPRHELLPAMKGLVRRTGGFLKQAIL